MADILVRMKVDVWKGKPPEISWVQINKITKHSVIYEVIRTRKDPKTGEKKAVKEERRFSRARLERVEAAARGWFTPGEALIHWIQDDREPITGGYCYQMALFNCLERINADFRRAAVRINELEELIAQTSAEVWKPAAAGAISGREPCSPRRPPSSLEQG